MKTDLFARRGAQGRYVPIADRIDASGDCWIWTGALDRAGYGRINMWPAGARFVHRVVYEALVGPIPEGLELDHLCYNPPCCNPDHLVPATRLDNLRTTRNHISKRRKRQAHCKWGHEYTPENTLYNNGKRPGRYCKACIQERRTG